MSRLGRTLGTGLLLGLLGVVVACEPGGSEAVDAGHCATSDCGILDAACVSPACGDASSLASDAPDAMHEDVDRFERPDATSDATLDAWIEPPTSELILEAVSSRDVPDCFPFLSRAPIRERAFAYKRVFAQVIAGVPREVTLRAYVFTPPGFDPSRDAPLPTIAMFHGGGWWNGTPVLWIPAARYFAARGMVAVVFQYRLGRLHGATPRQSTADALSAVRWLRLNADALGVDTSRIATTGDSAGGHLALATVSVDPVRAERDGADDVSTRPAVTMPLYPISNVRRVIEGEPPGDPSLIEIDPISSLEAVEAVPTLILHGTADPLYITQYADSVAYCARHDELSDTDWTVVPYEGLGHNFFPEVDMAGRGTLYPSVLTYLDSFLLSRGWLGGVLADVSMYAYGAASHCGYSIEDFVRLEAEYGLYSDPVDRPIMSMLW